MHVEHYSQVAARPQDSPRCSAIGLPDIRFEEVSGDRERPVPHTHLSCTKRTLTYQQACGLKKTNGARATGTDRDGASPRVTPALADCSTMKIPRAERGTRAGEQTGRPRNDRTREDASADVPNRHPRDDRLHHGATENSVLRIGLDAFGRMADTSDVRGPRLPSWTYMTRRRCMRDRAACAYAVDDRFRRSRRAA
jgi:hypothetical protein